MIGSYYQHLWRLLLVYILAAVYQLMHTEVEARHTEDDCKAFAADNPGWTYTREVCIDFTFDDPNWSYTRQPPWGLDSGTFGGLKNGKLCVPTNDQRGGALFISTVSHPGPGSTKLECKFPTSGEANCDVSLVDGYSLSVTCKSGDMRVGGDINLWKRSDRCKHIEMDHCVNEIWLANGPAENSVDAFFQPAIRDGNEYCIWWSCHQNYYFPVTQQLSCHISGTW